MQITVRLKAQTAGILGQIYNSVAVIDCINSGSVIGGTKYAGGIVGYTRRWVSSVKCYIQGCINLGTISGNDLQYKGGIFGVIFYMDADIVNCYSLKSTNEVFGNYRNSGNKISAVIDFGENYKDELLTIRDSKNLDSIEKIFAEIEKVSPGVFKYENGTISFK